MRIELEKLLGEEVSIYTVHTSDPFTDHNGYFQGTLRRLSEVGLELRRSDGNLSYIAFRHIVRFVARP